MSSLPACRPSVAFTSQLALRIPAPSFFLGTSLSSQSGRTSALRDSGNRRRQAGGETAGTPPLSRRYFVVEAQASVPPPNESPRPGSQPPQEFTAWSQGRKILAKITHHRKQKFKKVVSYGKQGRVVEYVPADGGESPPLRVECRSPHPPAYLRARYASARRNSGIQSVSPSPSPPAQPASPRAGDARSPRPASPPVSASAAPSPPPPAQAFVAPPSAAPLATPAAPTAEALVKTVALSAAIGLLGSAAGALIGLGGAFVIVPLMTQWGGLRQHEANATSLLAVAFTGIVGAYNYSVRNVCPAYAAVLAASAMVTARLGAGLTERVAPARLRKYFGWFLIWAAFMIPVKAWLVSRAGAAGAAGAALAGAPLAEAARHLLAQPRLAASLLLAGAAAGFSSGFLGVGGGTVMVPALVVAAGLPQQLAQGTSLLAMVPPAVVGAITHGALGHLRLDLAPGLVAGACAGATLGSRLAVWLPEKSLKAVFAAMLLYFGSRYAGPPPPRPGPHAPATPAPRP
eukprot:tig00000237_g20451.t2